MFPKHFLLISNAFILYLLPATAFGTDAAVTVVSLSFSPSDVTINVGDKVTWTGLQFGVGHNVSQSADASSNVYDGSGFRSGNQGAVPTFEHTFNTAGIFFYICEPHAGSGMKGSVTVQEFRFTTQPSGPFSIEEGQPLSLFAEATSPDMNPITYQWFKDDVAVGGETGTTYDVTNSVTFADGGEYHVEANDGIDTIQSNIHLVTVLAPGTLPVAGLLGLMALGAGLAAVGTVVFRRKK